jgi:serine/threonine-protein kinase
MTKEWGVVSGGTYGEASMGATAPHATAGTTPVMSTTMSASRESVAITIAVAPKASSSAADAGTSSTDAAPSTVDAGSHGGYTYAGCPVFGPNGWFDTDIANAPVDPNSAAYIKATVDAGDTGGFHAWVPPNEKINLANNSTPLLTIHPKVSWYSFPYQVPWASNFYIQTESDKHAMVVQTDTCHLYEFWDTTYSSGTFSAYSGADWDMTKPFEPGKNDAATFAGGGTASGIPLVAIMVKPEELAAGVIPHSLGWDAVAYTVGRNYVAPAKSSGGLDYKGPSSDLPMPYGSHIRLKASFNDSAFSASAKAVAAALKRYGAYLYDTGCCGSIPLVDTDFAPASTYWHSSDTSAIGSIHITDFEVIPPSAK